MPELYDQVQEAASAIRARWPGKPRVGIILGTGLGGLAEEVAAEAAIPYANVPHFPVPTVQGHAGQSALPLLEGQDALFHRVLGHQAIDQDRAGLAKPMRPVSSLILDGRIPPGVEEENMIRGSEIEPNATGP